MIKETPAPAWKTATKLVLIDADGTPRVIITGEHPRRIIRHDGVFYVSDEEPNTNGPELRSYRPVNVLTLLDTTELHEGATLLYVASRLTKGAARPGPGEPDGRSNPGST